MKQRLFDILAHGPQLQADALAGVGDANEAYFLVHGVVATAFDDKHTLADDGALNLSMRRSINAWKLDADPVLIRA
ncbi:MAG: hypothetical protein ABW199_01820 [Caulobacterales bacterium]